MAKNGMIVNSEEIKLPTNKIFFNLWEYSQRKNIYIEKNKTALQEIK